MQGGAPDGDGSLCFLSFHSAQPFAQRLVTTAGNTSNGG